MSQAQWPSLSEKLKNLRFAVDEDGKITAHASEPHKVGYRTLDYATKPHMDDDGNLGLENHQGKIGPREYSVTVGPVPCFATVENFGPWMDPKYWPQFVTGVRTKILNKEHESDQGWRGQFLETLYFHVPGMDHDLFDLNTELNCDFFHGKKIAYVNFDLAKSYDNVLTKDEGYIRAEPFLSGHGVHLYCKKTIQLSKDAPQNKLGPLIPTMLRVIITVWLWEYSINFMLHHEHSSLSDEHKGLLSGPIGEWLFEKEMRSQLGRDLSVLTGAK